MMTLKPLALAPETSFPVSSGCRCAEETWNSYETPAFESTSNAGSMRGLSLSDPTTIRTSAMTSHIPHPTSHALLSRRILQDGIILLSLFRGVPRIRDQPPHLRQRHAPRRAGRRDDVLFHHQ